VHISAKADYAVRAAIQLASSSEFPVTSESIAREQQIPAKFLEAILSELRHSGLVKSRRGAHGGYWLSRPAEEISAAYERVRAASAGDDVVVQAMAAKGIELMVSCIRDQESGVAVVCRTGGVLVELAGLTAILTGEPAWWPDQLARSPLQPLLSGWRGAPAADAGALVEFAARLRDEVCDQPQILIVECNPVLVHPTGHGVTVVDVLTYVEADQ